MIPAPDSAVDQLLAATEAIRRALAELQQSSCIPMDNVKQVFAAIERIAHLRNSWKGSPASSVPQFKRAEAQYRAALAEWAEQLPRLHGWLLAEKQRLDGRREHAQSVSTWLETQKQTR